MQYFESDIHGFSLTFRVVYNITILYYRLMQNQTWVIYVLVYYLEKKTNPYTHAPPSTTLHLVNNHYENPQSPHHYTYTGGGRTLHHEYIYPLCMATPNKIN